MAQALTNTGMSDGGVLVTSTRMVVGSTRRRAPLCRELDIHSVQIASS